MARAAPVALTLLALLSGCAGGRVYTSRRVHVGVRPAVIHGHDDGTGAGLTVQVSTDWPP